MKNLLVKGVSINVNFTFIMTFFRKIKTQIEVTTISRYLMMYQKIGFIKNFDYMSHRKYSFCEFRIKNTKLMSKFIMKLNYHSIIGI